MSGIETKSQLIYSDRKNNVYRQEDTINFYIPPSFKLLNTLNTYLVFNVKMTGKQYKACLSEKAGIYSIIRSVQITTGDGSTVLETLDSYAIFQALKYYYEMTETKRNMAILHEGLPSKMYLGENGSCNQYIDATKNSDFFKQIEVIAPLYLSGCLYREQIFPNLATGGLRIKVELYDAQTAMQAVTAPLYQLKDGITQQVSKSGGGYSETTGYAILETFSVGVNSIVLKKVGDELTGDEQRVLTPDVTNVPDLFSVGQKIQIAGSSEPYEVTGTGLTEENRIEVTFSPALKEEVSEDACVNIRSESSYSDMGYELSSVRMNVNTVEVPNEWIQKNIVDKINRGAMNFDIDSYSDYPYNISEGSLNNTLPLNIRNKKM